MITPIFSLSYMLRLIPVKEKAENYFSNLLLHFSGGNFLTEMTQNPQGNKSFGLYKYAAIPSLIKLSTVLL